ncbi:MAG: AAA domain-containing protein [Planctomycetota bacterium]
MCRKVQELLDCGVAAGDIAVITPYAAQVRFLREQLPVAGLGRSTAWTVSRAGRRRPS